ncbi:MAG: type IV pilin protein [Prevotellaceae bacterium]|jgi:type IV pilus assembly protein PilE|nr:type IV pilin protein [Prevotellaceae bacterium]
MINIGKLIKEELKNQRRTVKWFAKELDCKRANVHKLFNKKSIDSQLLLRICIILQRTFFDVYIEAERKAFSKPFRERRVSAFSLPELLVVIVIIGILVLIALPNLMPLISRAKAVEAQQQLIFLHSLEKTYFYTYSKYSQSLDEIGFEQQPLVSEGGTANYVIEITEATDNTFRATATAVVDFDQDGVYNVWEIDSDKRLTEVGKD